MMENLFPPENGILQDHLPNVKQLESDGISQKYIKSTSLTGQEMHQISIQLRTFGLYFTDDFVKAQFLLILMYFWALIMNMWSEFLYQPQFFCNCPLHFSVRTMHELHMHT